MQTKMNIIQELQKLVDKHVLYYSSDFEVDKEIFAEVANSAHLEEKVMLWLCREHGTHCLRADQVYIRDTASHNTFRYYAEQNYDNCIARIVIPREIQDGDIVGDIFEIDYQKAVEDVTRNSVEPLVCESRWVSSLLEKNKATTKEGWVGELFSYPTPRNGGTYVYV